MTIVSRNRKEDSIVSRHGESLIANMNMYLYMDVVRIEGLGVVRRALLEELRSRRHKDKDDQGCTLEQSERGKPSRWVQVRQRRPCDIRGPAMH